MKFSSGDIYFHVFRNVLHIEEWQCLFPIFQIKSTYLTMEEIQDKDVQKKAIQTVDCKDSVLSSMPAVGNFTSNPLGHRQRHTSSPCCRLDAPPPRCQSTVLVILIQMRGKSMRIHFDKIYSSIFYLVVVVNQIINLQARMNQEVVLNEGWELFWSVCCCCYWSL